MGHGGEIYTLLHEALRRWHKPNLQLSDLFKASFIFRETRLDRQAAYRQLEDCIDEFAAEHPEQAELLLRRFRDNDTSHKIAFDIHRSIDHVNRLQRNAIQALADFLTAREQRSRQAEIHRQIAALPPKNYHELIGRGELLNDLCSRVSNSKQSEVIALSALGGSGKTSLADAIARRMANDLTFDELVWLNVHPDESEWLEKTLPLRLIQKLDPDFPLSGNIRAQLGDILRATPTLVIVDGVSITRSSQTGINQLMTWSGPSKFILTARELPEPGINLYSARLSSLSEQETKEFLFSESLALGFDKPEPVLNESVSEVYQITGGNPLALKLVIGLLRYWPMEDCLQALRSGSSSTTKELYSHIYQANWDRLPVRQQNLLLAFLLAGDEGLSIDHLEGLLSESKADLRDNLLELMLRFLVEKRGLDQRPTYGVHQLTHTFLNQVLVNLQAKQQKEFHKRIGAAIGYWQQQMGAGDPAETVENTEDSLYRAAALGLQDRNHWVAAANLLISIHP